MEELLGFKKGVEQKPFLARGVGPVHDLYS